MKTSLNHLPETKQNQILQITGIIKEVAKPEKIILFGSYAKGKQVEHRYTGKDGINYEYISDYDFLVVTKSNSIKEYELEDIINNKLSLFDPAVNVQIHEIDYINQGLEFGQYFFTDIIKEGILLFDTREVHFAKARELTREEEKQKAQNYLDIWFTQGAEFLESVPFHISRKSLKPGIFVTHQAAESFYYAALLVFTGYKPKTHNLWKLRRQAKSLSEELFLVFPLENDKQEDHFFDLLKRGYIDARYKPEYSISKEELGAILERVTRMKEIVEKICNEKIMSL